MAHMTEAQFKRLRLGSKPNGARVADEGTPVRKAKGRARLERVAYPDAPVEFEVHLPYDPRPKERPRTVSDMRQVEAAFMSAKGNLAAFRSMLAKGFSRTFTPKGTKEYEDLIALAARTAMRSRPPMRCPVEVRITFVLKGEAGQWPTSSADGDGDNLEKAVLDALNGIAFEDDRQVVRSVREKVCGPEPRLIIGIAPARP